MELVLQSLQVEPCPECGGSGRVVLCTSAGECRRCCGLGQVICMGDELAMLGPDPRDPAVIWVSIAGMMWPVARALRDKREP